MGLVTRRVSAVDNRVREVAITEKGRAMAAALDVARERLMAAVLREWDAQELEELVRLTRRLADDALAWVRDTAGKPQANT